MFCDFIAILVWIAETVNALLYICFSVAEDIAREMLGGDLEVVIQVHFLRVACQYSVSHSGHRTLALLFSYSVLSHKTLY
jgi:hypothetical protein